MLYIQWTDRFRKDFEALSKVHQHQVARAVELLDRNWRYPGLQVKKVHGHPGVWEARISQSHRMTFSFEGKFRGLDVCMLRRVGTHAVFKSP
ncbi:MAG TPA: hypothetical protein VGL38_08850 [bacterium]